MKTWTNGDVDGGQILTDNDHLYPIHINELRTKANLDAILNVKDYGAVGDGNHDDTAAIQSAVDIADEYARTTAYSCVIYFPRGTYLISGTITSHPSTNAIGPTFIGDGKNVTTIKTNHATANMFNIATDYYGDFYNLNFTCTDSRTSGYAIYYSGGPATSMTGQTTIRDCNFYGNMINGIGMLNNYNFTIDNVTMTCTGGVGIDLANPINADTGGGFIFNCTLTGYNGGTGILSKIGGVHLVNNSIQFWANGFTFDLCDGNTGIIMVQDNQFEGYDNYGISLIRSAGTHIGSRIFIQNNELWSPSPITGIWLANGGYSDIMITGNLIDGDVSDYGINIESSLTKSIISGNSIHHSNVGLNIVAEASYIYYGPNAFYDCNYNVVNNSSTSGSYVTKMTE